jgi:DNA-binding NtrC family response regulator
LRRRVLLVDDDPSVRFALRDFLEGKGYEVDEAETSAAALEVFQSSPPDVAILDYSLPDGTALELLPRLRAAESSVPLVVLTGHGSIDVAVQAIKEGAEHFLTKPVELPALLVILERLLDNQRQKKRNLAGRSRESRRAVDPFLGTSPAIRQLAEEARMVASAEAPVLIHGETGSGKGVLAAWLHRNGPRADEAFVDLNCATLSRELLESELFGHQKGAFTGAVSAKPGLLEVAHRGTLFLDEIGDMDPLVQPKLLKVVEEHRFRRVGEVRDRQVDVRLVAATHHDLSELVRDKTFRSDLFFRISTFPLVVAPLRERKEDIPLLARDLCERIAADMGRSHLTLSEAALRALVEYPWPGNIRELRNVLERALLLGRGSTVEAGDLRFLTGVAAEPEPGAPELTLEEVERRHIERVLREEKGRVDPAAQRLGVPRSSLYKRIRSLGIVVPRQ